VLLQQAGRDMEVEGFSNDRVVATLRASILDGAVEPIVIGGCRLSEATGQRWSAELFDAAPVRDSLTVEISVVAEAGVPHWNPTGAADGIEHRARRPSIKGERVVHWEAQKSLLTPIIDDTQLTPGVIIDGPGIVESSITNYVITPGWELKVDERNNYLMERKRG